MSLPDSPEGLNDTVENVEDGPLSFFPEGRMNSAIQISVSPETIETVSTERHCASLSPNEENNGGNKDFTGNHSAPHSSTHEATACEGHSSTHEACEGHSSTDEATTCEGHSSTRGGTAAEANNNDSFSPYTTFPQSCPFSANEISLPHYYAFDPDEPHTTMRYDFSRHSSESARVRTSSRSALVDSKGFVEATATENKQGPSTDDISIVESRGAQHAYLYGESEASDEDGGDAEDEEDSESYEEDFSDSSEADHVSGTPHRHRPETGSLPHYSESTTEFIQTGAGTDGPEQPARDSELRGKSTGRKKKVPYRLSCQVGHEKDDVVYVWKPRSDPGVTKTFHAFCYRGKHLVHYNGFVFNGTSEWVQSLEEGYEGIFNDEKTLKSNQSLESYTLHADAE